MLVLRLNKYEGLRSHLGFQPGEMRNLRRAGHYNPGFNSGWAQTRINPAQLKEINIMAKNSTTRTEKKRVKVKTLPAKAKTLSANEGKKVKGGSDRTGNTVYVGSANGGVWKTT